MKKLNISVVESTLPPKDESVIWLQKVPDSGLFVQYKILSANRLINRSYQFYGQHIIRKFVDGYWIVLGEITEGLPTVKYLVEDKPLAEAIDGALEKYYRGEDYGSNQAIEAS